MKEFFKNAIAAFVGRSAVSVAARIVIALLSLYAGSATDFGDAVGQAIDKERSIAAAAQLINETPAPEIKKALAEETKKDEAKDAPSTDAK